MTKDEIKLRQDQLHTILNECQLIVNGSGSDFWGLLRRTLKQKSESYKQDCYAAAEDEHKSIRNFLGRMEAIDWIINLVDVDFLDQARRARRGSTFPPIRGTVVAWPREEHP